MRKNFNKSTQLNVHSLESCMQITCLLVFRLTRQHGTFTDRAVATGRGQPGNAAHLSCLRILLWHRSVRGAWPLLRWWRWLRRQVGWAQILLAWVKWTFILWPVLAIVRVCNAGTYFQNNGRPAAQHRLFVTWIMRKKTLIISIFVLQLAGALSVQRQSVLWIVASLPHSVCELVTFPPPPPPGQFHVQIPFCHF